jgi:hypothetical protein
VGDRGRALNFNPNIFVTEEPLQMFKPYDKPFWDFNNGGRSEVKWRKSAVISRKSVVILPENVVLLPEERGNIFVMKIVANQVDWTNI